MMASPLIITGMHRSGTSLVSSLVRAGGVHVGDELIEANSANPRGYFEDIDFYEFHEQLLHDRGLTYLYVDSEFSFEPTDAEISRAQRLIAARAHRSMWGWKDPRTSLFLDFWSEQLPDARFLFVYRHPLHVLLSLMRRGEFDTYPLLFAGLEAWRIYNERILRFCGRHTEHRILASVEGVLDRSNDFLGLLKRRLGVDLNLNEDSLQQIYRAEELNRAQPPRAAATALAGICPAELELYDQLNALADLPEARTDAVETGSATLAALDAFVRDLPQPIAPAPRQGLLQVLLALLDPKASDARMGRMRQTAQDQQSRIDQLWQYAQQLQRVNSELRSAHEKGEGRVAALEEQTERQQQLIDQQQTVIDDQSAELSKIWPNRICDAAHSAWQYLRGA